MKSNVLKKLCGGNLIQFSQLDKFILAFLGQYSFGGDNCQTDRLCFRNSLMLSSRDEKFVLDLANSSLVE